jgi:hypothetical protein
MVMKRRLSVVKCASGLNVLVAWQHFEKDGPHALPTASDAISQCCHVEGCGRPNLFP